MRDAERFFAYLFPGVVGLHPSSFHRRVRKLRRFLEPLRRDVLSEMIGDPETLLIDSTLLSVLHPRQVSQGSGFPGAAWVRSGSFSVYGVKLHLRYATHGVLISYELTAANIADISLTEELIVEVALGEGVARRLLGDLAYSSEELRKALAEVDILLCNRALRAAARGQTASRDRSFEPQEGLWPGRDVGEHSGRVGHQDRGQDLRLHLRLLGQQDVGMPPWSHQGIMGMNLAS